MGIEVHPTLRVCKASIEQTKNKLKERFNISIGEKINSGTQGSVYSIKNNDNYVVKFLKNESDAVSDSVRNRISVMGGGITKPLDSYKLDNGTVVEIYKRREKDCSELNLFKLKNNEENNDKDIKEDNQSIISIMAQNFLTVETACNNGVILCDLKPDNMLIKDKKVTISDPGSSITVEEGKDGTFPQENPKFSAFSDPQKTVKSPVFSIGGIMFECSADKDFSKFLGECGLDVGPYGVIFNPSPNDEESKRENVRIAKNIKDNITPDIINLKKAFPDVDFEKKEKEKGKEKIEEEVKKKFCELFKGMLMIDTEQRDSITESKKKLINTIKYLVDEVGLDIEKDLKLNDKILFNLGMFDRMKDKDKYVEDERNEVLNNIEMFLDNNKKPKNKKEKEHMATIFGIEKFDENGEIVPKEVNLSRSARECLKNIKTFITNNKKEDTKLEENIKNLRGKISEKEYLLLKKLANDSKIIKQFSKEIANEEIKLATNNTSNRIPKLNKNKPIITKPNLKKARQYTHYNLRLI